MSPKAETNASAHGAYLVVVFLVIAAGLPLDSGSKAEPGCDAVLRSFVALSHHDPKWQSLAATRSLWRGLGAYPILVREKHRGIKSIRCVFFLSLPLVASRSFTSHAVAVKENTMVVVAADVAHLIATGLWGGGLLALFWVLYRGVKKSALPLSWAAETVRRFSRLALGSVAVLVLTGLYQSWIQVGSLRTLFGTDYGRVLLFKLVLFIAMLGFGALNFLSTRPRLLRAAEGNTKDLSSARKRLGGSAQKASSPCWSFS